MITAMGEIILSIVAFALFMYIVIHDYNTRKNKESHESWLSECKDCLHSIENEFRHRCEEITKESFSKYTGTIYWCNLDCKRLSGELLDLKYRIMFNLARDYKEEIDRAKQEYLNTLYDKATERMKWRGFINFTSFPDHLEKAYERNISEIADTYCNFGDLMSSQISKIRDNNI